METLFNDFKNAWSRPNNGLIQLIILNIAVFVVLGIIAVITAIFGIDGVFAFIYKQFTIPAPIGEFILRPWTIITYAFAHSFRNLWHIIMNMLVLYWFGKVFVEYYGSQKLVNLYVLGAIAGGITYLMAYNLIPFYSERMGLFDGMVGASAAVYAITVATATLMPDYRFHLIFIGPVKIVYIAAFVIFTSLLGTVGDNAGGSLAHLGGALIGFIYGRQMLKGVEIGRWVFHAMEFVKSFFVNKPKIKVSHRKSKSQKSSSSTHSSSNGTSNFTQAEIDKILDKISEGGYESLTKEEKQKLFDASNR